MGFAALAVGDLEGIDDLASRVCEFDSARMRALLSAVETARAKANAMGTASQAASANVEGVTKLSTPQEIFIYFDADRTGVMDLDEFAEVIKNMGINMSRQRAMQFFAKVACMLPLLALALRMPAQARAASLPSASAEADFRSHT